METLRTDGSFNGGIMDATLSISPITSLGLEGFIKAFFEEFMQLRRLVSTR
jgi:hypothetical protein